MSISISAPARRSAVSQVLDMVIMARPQFWLVSWLTMWLGFVLATHRLLPTTAALGQTLWAALVAGPLVWLAVLAVNDAYDLEGDRLNDRKDAAPVVTGKIDRRRALTVGAAASVLAIGAAIPVGRLFALGVAGTVLLGWAYSAPPIRLKARAGFDVAANGLAIGVLGPLGGWVLGAGTLSGFPWQIAILGWLLGIALYLPTTIADVAADRAAGYRTFAVVLGAGWTAGLGLVAWSLAAFWSLTMTLTGVVLPRSLLPLHLPLVPIMIVIYHRLISPTVTFRRVTALASLFLIPCLAFVLTHTGIIG